MSVLTARCRDDARVAPDAPMKRRSDKARYVAESVRRQGHQGEILINPEVLG
jgi:hypothetical protein